MSTRVSVLHVVLSTAVGGMENVICNLVAAHDHRRFAIRVACIDEIGPLSRRLEEHGVPSFLVPPMRRGISKVYPSSLVKLIRQTGCRIVHTHSGCWSKVAAACLWVPEARLLYTEHGRAFPETRGRVLANRIAARRTQRIVAVGEPLRDHLLKAVKLPPGKVVTIRNGVDTGRFKACAETRSQVRAELGYSEDDVVVAMVARLVPVKNHHLLLEAFRLASARCARRAKLLIVGDGPLRHELEDLVGSMSLTSRVRFVGTRLDVERLLTGVDIATLSSASEGSSLTLLEAMAAGLPVVATKVGGNGEVLGGGRNGVLVGQDASEYAAALSALIESGTRRRLLGDKARRATEREWSIDTMTRRYEEQYLALASLSL